MKKQLKIAIICGVCGAALAVGCMACGGKKTYTVTFDTLGGSTVAAYSLTEGETIKRPTTIPTKEMFSFNDWYTDTTFTQKFEFGGKMPAQNITVYAGWLGEGSITVTFDANGGAFSDGSTVAYEYGLTGEAFTESVELPQNYGYVFKNWYKDSACTTEYVFDTYPTENITLYAGWSTNSSSFAYVSYYGNGELLAKQPKEKSAAWSDPELFDDTLAVDGWYTDAAMKNKFVETTAVTSDISLYASYYTKGMVFAAHPQNADELQVSAYNGDARKVCVPSMYEGKPVTAVGEYAFYRSNDVAVITDIVLPRSVTTLYRGAFYDCQYLVNVNIGNGVTELGDDLFYNNKRLKNFGDISAVTRIGDGAFNGCSVLRAIEIPSGVTYIGKYAFGDCAELAEIKIPAQVKVISEYMFSGCVELKKVDITAPQLTSIDKCAFENCKALEQVIIRSVSPTRFSAVTLTEFVSPFADSDNVKVCVPSNVLNSYKDMYGYLDSETLADKFDVIG